MRLAGASSQSGRMPISFPAEQIPSGRRPTPQTGSDRLIVRPSTPRLQLKDESQRSWQVASRTPIPQSRDAC